MTMWRGRWLQRLCVQGRGFVLIDSGNTYGSTAVFFLDSIIEQVGIILVST